LNSAKFFAVGQDYRARNSLARALEGFGNVVQLDSIEEIGVIEDRETYIFIDDNDGKAVENCERLAEAGTICFAIGYNEAPALSRVVECLSGPLCGYLQWPGDQQELMATLRALSDKAKSQVRQRISQAKARKRLGVLSEREMEVARGVATGLSSKELAPSLGVSFRTVEFHRANIMAKLGVRNIASVIRTVIEAGEAYEEIDDDLNFAA